MGRGVREPQGTTGGHKRGPAFLTEKPRERINGATSDVAGGLSPGTCSCRDDGRQNYRAHKACPSARYTTRLPSSWIAERAPGFPTVPVDQSASRQRRRRQSYRRSASVPDLQRFPACACPPTIAPPRARRRRKPDCRQSAGPIAGGPAPVRAYLHELLPDVLEVGSLRGSSSAPAPRPFFRMSLRMFSHRLRYTGISSPEMFSATGTRGSFTMPEMEVCRLDTAVAGRFTGSTTSGDTTGFGGPRFYNNYDRLG